MCHTSPSTSAKSSPKVCKGRIEDCARFSFVGERIHMDFDSHAAIALKDAKYNGSREMSAFARFGCDRPDRHSPLRAFSFENDVPPIDERRFPSSNSGQYVDSLGEMRVKPSPGVGRHSARRAVRLDGDRAPCRRERQHRCEQQRQSSSSG